MGQIKIFGLASEMNKHKEKMSKVVHSCIVDALKYPEDKRFHRFFPMAAEDFYFSKERSEKYTIIEISIFEGRTVETKKELIRLLFDRFEKELGVPANDLEITLFETPKHNWGIRGLPGDELVLNYTVNV